MPNNELYLNIDYNYDHQRSLSKRKFWYSSSCLQFLKRAVPFAILMMANVIGALKCAENAHMTFPS